MRSKLVRGDRFTDKIFKPYVTAIGELALAWNVLHEKLGWLFYNFIEQGEGRGALLWNAPQFDRPKRALLKAVAKAMPTQMQSDYPRLKDDILWLIERVDSLEDDRNTAVHSPLLASGESNILAVENILALPNILHATDVRVEPNVRLSNARAMKLAKKDLLTEFRWCRDAALILRDFALSLDYATMPDGHPWPDRPSLPNRGQKKTRRRGQRPALPK